MGRQGTSRMQQGWIDISLPLKGKMRHLPDDEKPLAQEISLFLERSKGDQTDLFNLNIISHTGTHIDAPLHFIPNGATIDTMPIDTSIGPARIIEIEDRILESVNLEGVRPGPCELICLSLRLAGGDAAPARAIVRAL